MQDGSRISFPTFHLQVHLSTSVKVLFIVILCVSVPRGIDYPMGCDSVAHNLRYPPTPQLRSREQHFSRFRIRHLREISILLTYVNDSLSAWCILLRRMMSEGRFCFALQVTRNPSLWWMDEQGTVMDGRMKDKDVAYDLVSSFSRGTPHISDSSAHCAGLRCSWSEVVRSCLGRPTPLVCRRYRAPFSRSTPHLDR